MRVVFVLLNFTSSKIDGVGYFVKRILNSIEIHCPGIEVTVCVPRGFDAVGVLELTARQAANLRTFNVPVNPVLKVLYKLFVFPREIGTENFDLVYYTAVPVGFYPAGVRVVTTIHDLIALIVDRKQGRLYKTYYRLLVLNAVRQSRVLTAVSANTKKDLIRILGVDEKKVKVVPCFVGGPVIRSTSSDAFFLTISTLQPAKNIARNILAFKEFLVRHPESGFRYVVVGRQGWASEDLVVLATRAGLSDSVVFKGYVSEDERADLLRHCSAMIFTSLYEGFGLPPLEAMYYGKPSVVSNSSSLPEVVGKSGILVDPYDVKSIAQGMHLVLQPEIREVLVRNIPEQIQKYDPKNALMKLEAAFQLAISTR